MLAGLEDKRLLAQLSETERAILSGNIKPGLAQRYIA